MTPRTVSRRRLWAALAVLAASGCAEPEAEAPPSWQVDPATLRPAGGTITLNGKPLAKAVVAFYAKSGVPSVGETNADGHYDLQTMEMKGVPPGDYKVGVSYFLSPDGEPQGLAERSAMMPSRAMLSARESLPLEYADANRTTLKATVGSQGGSFDFNIEATPKPPEKQPAEKSEARGPDGPANPSGTPAPSPGGDAAKPEGAG
jgi:hypothetical protein